MCLLLALSTQLPGLCTASGRTGCHKLQVRLYDCTCRVSSLKAIEFARRFERAVPPLFVSFQFMRNSIPLSCHGFDVGGHSAVDKYTYAVAYMLTQLALSSARLALYDKTCTFVSQATGVPHTCSCAYMQSLLALFVASHRRTTFF